MAYVLKRRGRFMEGHSYATGIGYRFSWTVDESKARRFSDGDPSVDTFRAATGAQIERRQNTRAELREIGRERVRIMAAGKQPTTIHTRINQRAKGGG